MHKIIYNKVNKSSKPNHLIAWNLNILVIHNKYLTLHNNNNLFGIINGISNNLKYSNNNHNKYTHNNSNYLIMLNIKINMLGNSN